jgi:hypothetical protein
MRRAPVLLLLLLVPACATPAQDYPSLALRDAERVTGTFEPEPPAPYVPPATPAAVIDRLAQLAADAAAADRAFQAAAPDARAAVGAAGGEFGGDGWARASVAVAGLEAARSKAMIALADLDRLMIDAALEGGELDRIVAVRDGVTAQVQAQNATVAGLLERLP